MSFALNNRIKAMEADIQRLKEQAQADTFEELRQIKERLAALENRKPGRPAKNAQEIS